jgi:hypothetical protein
MRRATALILSSSRVGAIIHQLFCQRDRQLLVHAGEQSSQPLAVAGPHRWQRFARIVELPRAVRWGGTLCVRSVDCNAATRTGRSAAADRAVGGARRAHEWPCGSASARPTEMHLDVVGVRERRWAVGRRSRDRCEHQQCHRPQQRHQHHQKPLPGTLLAACANVGTDQRGQARTYASDAWLRPAAPGAGRRGKAK